MWNANNTNGCNYKLDKLKNHDLETFLDRYMDWDLDKYGYIERNHEDVKRVYVDYSPSIYIVKYIPITKPLYIPFKLFGHTISLGLYRTYE